jgi:hypothetical protein
LSSWSEAKDIWPEGGVNFSSLVGEIRVRGKVESKGAVISLPVAPGPLAVSQTEEPMIASTLTKGHDVKTQNARDTSSSLVKEPVPYLIREGAEADLGDNLAPQSFTRLPLH